MSGATSQEIAEAPASVPAELADGGHRVNVRSIYCGSKGNESGDAPSLGGPPLKWPHLQHDLELTKQMRATLPGCVFLGDQRTYYFILSVRERVLEYIRMTIHIFSRDIFYCTCKGI